MFISTHIKTLFIALAVALCIPAAANADQQHIGDAARVTATTPVASIDSGKLTLNIQPVEGALAPGEANGFTVVVKNTALIAARNVRVCVKVPKGTKLIKLSGKTGHGRVCWKQKVLRSEKTVTYLVMLHVNKTTRKVTVKAKANADNAESVTDRLTVQ